MEQLTLPSFFKGVEMQTETARRESRVNCPIPCTIEISMKNERIRYFRSKLKSRKSCAGCGSAVAAGEAIRWWTSALFTGATALKDDNFAARAIVGELLGHLLGHPQEPFAPVHLLPDVLRADAGSHPQHHEVVDEVGAFLDHSVAVAVHGIDDDFDRFFGKLFCHLAAAGAQQPRGPRGRRIVVTAGEGRAVEAVDRISHRL